MRGELAWYFQNHIATGHIHANAISKQVGDLQVQFKTNADGTQRSTMKNQRADHTLVLGGGAKGAWKPQDLRRAGATIPQKLGVGLDVIDRCQNQVLAGSKVRRQYMHHYYAEQKCEVWAALSECIATLPE